MHGIIRESITTQSGTKGIIGSRDLRRLFFDTTSHTDDILNSPMQTWRQKRLQSYRIEQTKRIDEMNREVANNIIYVPCLSQYLGNPYDYPAVPKYKIPKGKKYTPAQIAQIKLARDFKFIENNIEVGSIPLPSEDMDDEFAQLTGIDPDFQSRTIIHTNNIDVITGHIQAPNCTIPEVTNCVGYMVNIYVDPKTHKQYLSHIYVYNDAEAINSLLSFLRDFRVENMDDLRNSGEHFVKLLLNK